MFYLIMSHFQDHSYAGYSSALSKKLTEEKIASRMSRCVSYDSVGSPFDIGVNISYQVKTTKAFFVGFISRMT